MSQKNAILCRTKFLIPLSEENRKKRIQDGFILTHGESIIGWARVLFDGVEVWRGDTSSYYHDAEGYLHAVYVEVRCFPPGIHTLRIEGLVLVGSGGGQSIPISYFGIREE